VENFFQEGCGMTRIGAEPIFLAMFFFVLSLLGCRGQEPTPAGDQKDFTLSILHDNKMMQFFSTNHPGLVILKYAQTDLDNDGKDDLIIIFRKTKDENRMCVIRQQETGFIESNSVPAPVSDQIIRFKDIDNKPPMEFIVQGRKGSKIGYAIFRIEAGTLTDLFGEGMEDCC
jgi:hypothetical protein